MDSSKVNGLLGQLDAGVPESRSDTLSNTTTTGAGARNYAWRQGDSHSDTEVQRSLADSNFPQLEDILEAEQLLIDLSEDLSRSANWTNDYWREKAPAGSLVRMTLAGTLFDSRFVAEIMKSWASALAGLQMIGSMDGSPTSAKAPHKFPRHPDIPPELDEFIPAVGPFSDGSQDAKLTREYLQGIVKVSRGLFTPGLHLVLQAYDGGDFAAVARLQEERRFLDAPSDVLFSRYGVEPQDWTLVGTIGHYPTNTVVQPPGSELGGSAAGFSRIRTAQYINQAMKFVGNLGFADLPKHPSFSVIPLAVYRAHRLGPTAGTDLVM